MSHYSRILFSVCLLTLCSFLALGQSGNIEGIVYDARTKERLVGAQIVIQGTGIGASANLNGEFRLVNIPHERADLLVSFISYEPVVIENIRIERGRTITLEVEMHEVSYQLEGVTVTARRTTHTETALITSLRNSQVVTSGISAQQISRSQDSDAAQVVRRIPGVTIIEDRFIIVRGLSERYNTVMLHNVIAPSMEADVRSFSFDIIPSSQIEQLLIHKSPSADLPGNFAGGAIQIITKAIPDRSGFEISYTNRYDDGTTFRNFYRSERSDNAWMGFGSDYFSLPEDFPRDLRTITNNNAELERMGKSLKNNWIPIEETAFLNQSASLAGMLRFNLLGMEVGNITTLSYSNSKSTNEVFRSDYNSYNHGTFDPNGNVIIAPQSLPIYNFYDDRFSNNIRLGVLHNWGINISKDHSVEIINLFNHNSTYRYVNRQGDHIDFGATMNNHNFQQIFRGLYSGQMNGKHQLTSSTKLNWTAGLSNSFREMPDYKQYRTDRNINDPESDFSIYVPIGGAQPYFMGRFYSSMEEKGHTYAGNISQTINLNAIPSLKPEFKAGFFTDYMEREFIARNIGYTASTLFFPQDLRRVSIDSLFHPDYLSITQGTGLIKLDEQSNPQDSYETSNDLFAWYGMVVLPMADRFTLSAGLRVEQNRRILKSATTTGPVNVDNNETHNLLSINMTYNLSQKLLLRAAYGKTINRPELREMAPFGFYDFDNNWVVSGNPFLKTALIDNYDLRLEYYPSLSEVISIAGFYKVFENAIERVVLVGAGSGGSKNFSFGNADEALVYGVEAEVRKSLMGMTGITFFDNLSVYFNTSLLKSTVTIGSGSRSAGRDTDPRPLQGQSPYIVNAGLFYNNTDADLQVNLLYNIIGKRLFTGGIRELDKVTITYPDIYEMPRNHLELTVSKRLSRHISMKAGIIDILNEPVVFLQDANEDGIFDRNNDQILRRYRPGISATLGLTFKM
ncbi:MAG: TonB-dependent receptor domain-containing protein [Bacteroidales bacterium]